MIAEHHIAIENWRAALSAFGMPRTDLARIAGMVGKHETHTNAAVLVRESRLARRARQEEPCS